jgi:hypothetical protein
MSTLERSRVITAGYALGHSSARLVHRSYSVDNEQRMTMKNKIKEDKPEAGKVYALTGTSSSRCIANGNTWAESEVKDPAAQELDTNKDGELE